MIPNTFIFRQKTELNAKYANDLALLAQAESLLPSLEQAVGDTGLNMNINKILSDKPLKSVHQFTHLGSKVSSTESDVNMDHPKS